MHARGSTVVRLPVHLNGQQAVYFDDDSELADVVAGGPPTSELIAWFLLNRLDPAAHAYKYQEIPEHYTFNKTTREWAPRSR